MRKDNDKEEEEWKKMVKLAVHVVASRLPEHRPTASLIARTNISAHLSYFRHGCSACHCGHNVKIFHLCSCVVSLSELRNIRSG